MELKSHCPLFYIDGLGSLLFPMTFLIQPAHCTLYESIVLLLRASEAASRQERRLTRLQGNWGEGFVCSITKTQAHGLNTLTSALPLHMRPAGSVLPLWSISKRTLVEQVILQRRCITDSVHMLALSAGESPRNLPHSKTHTPLFFLDMMFQSLSCVGMNVSASSKLRDYCCKIGNWPTGRIYQLRSSAKRSMLPLPPYSDILLM